MREKQQNERTRGKDGAQEQVQRPPQVRGGGRACISLAISNNVEIQLTVEEKADDVIDMME